MQTHKFIYFFWLILIVYRIFAIVWFFMCKEAWNIVVFEKQRQHGFDIHLTSKIANIIENLKKVKLKYNISKNLICC